MVLGRLGAAAAAKILMPEGAGAATIPRLAPTDLVETGEVGVAEDSGSATGAPQRQPKRFAAAGRCRACCVSTPGAVARLM